MITNIFLMALFCVGVYKASDTGMIFNRAKEFCYRYLPHKLFHPLFGCIYCMASIWGSVAYVLLSFIIGYNISVAEWLFCCVCCIPVNGFIYFVVYNAENK